MKRLAIILALVLAAGVARAEPRYIDYEVRIGTLATSIVTQTKNPIGYVDEILIQAPSRAAVTALVTVLSAPNVGTGITPTVLYTNDTLTAAAKARPRVAQTDNAGSSLSSLTVAERFLCAGDPTVLRVEQVSAVTGIVFKVWLKMDQ